LTHLGLDVSIHAMSAAVSAIIEERPAVAGKPSVKIRYAGDRAILVEYGEMEFDLTLNFFVLAVDAELREGAVHGVVETAPGFRSILVSYDPLQVATDELVAHLDAVHDGLEAEREMHIPSRIVRLPVAFDDAQTRAAVERYAHSIRKDAPNCEGGTNVDYIVRYNGLADREQLYDAVLSSEQWTAFIGFFPGLPFMFPLDPRHAVFVPKYNPTRTWTPEGALGLGGPCFAIYPVESAGGYQLVGRTLPIYDLQARNAAFRENPLLLGPGDRVKFHRVEEEELLALWDDVRADRYRYEIEDSPFDVGAYLDWTITVQEEAAERRRRREQAAAEAPVP
jgi:allophanate hydrolase subunit 1